MSGGGLRWWRPKMIAPLRTAQMTHRFPGNAPTIPTKLYRTQGQQKVPVVREDQLLSIGLGSGIWGDLSGIRQVVFVGSLVLVLVGLLAIPLGSRGWKIFLTVATLVGLFGLAYQLCLAL